MPSVDLTPFDEETSKNINLWLNGFCDEKSQEELKNLIANDPKEALDAFYTNLKFGTAGLRGLMGIGTNRMNIFTVRSACQGIANYINKHSTNNHSIFIGYDSRHNSRLFAEEAAKVFAANKIQVFLCNDLRPTPLISFGCRLQNCSAAVMITASHNAAQYNGLKVYWSKGEQVLSPHDIGIMQEVKKISETNSIKQVKELSHPFITIVGDEIDKEYIESASLLQHYPAENRLHGKDLKVVYTSLHGTGITLMPKMLSAWGFNNIEYVEEQIQIDGFFPTVSAPNPEDKLAMQLGIEKLQKSKGDILIANDPDGDRLGVGIKHRDKIVLLNGNQIACLLLSHVCEAMTNQNKMPSSAAFIKCVTTTELFQVICDAYGKPCFNVLPGFKYFAEKIKQWESNPKGHTFIFGGEESYGYLCSTLTYDKDAILASALICEAALHAKLNDQTLIDKLHELYMKHGLFLENMVTIDFMDNKDGKASLAASMKKLRTNIPKKINGVDIVCIEDFDTSIKTDFKNGQRESISLPKSNIVVLHLADDSKLIVRPSGTEPKVKLYCGVVDKNSSDIEIRKQQCHDKSMALLKAFTTIFYSSSLKDK